MQTFHNRDHGVHESQSELHNGKLVRSFECPERMAVILAALEADGFAAPEDPGTPPMEVIQRLHAPDYLAFLETAHDRWVTENGTRDAMGFTYPLPGLRRAVPPTTIDGAMGFYGFSVDTCITAGSWSAALSAAACAHAAAGAVSGGERTAFALARPPGHHAHGDLFGGYCYLNNAAVAVETLRDGGAARVALLDIDYHHGNGSQALFWERGDVLFLSLHADPVQEFPFFLGHADETGAGDGAGLTKNYPMPHGTGFAAWSEALEDAIRRITAFGADAMVVSLGVDTFEGDPISQFRLQTVDFPVIGSRLAAQGLPTVFVMEGGYAVDALGANVAGVLRGFSDA